MSRKFWAATAAVALVVLPLVLARPRVAEAKVTGLKYSIDGETWLGLDGALLEHTDIYLGASWANTSDAELTARVVLTLVNPEGEESEHPFEQTLAPGEEKRHEIFVSLYEGNYSLTATIFEAETMEVLDTQTVSFSAVVPSPEGAITQVLYQVDGTYPLNGADIALGTLINILVHWRNNVPGFDVRGRIDFVIDGVALTAISGQNQVVAPGQTGIVTFQFTLEDIVTYNGTVRLSGDIAL